MIEEFNVAYNENGRFGAQEFPDAQRFIKIDTPLGRQAADLALHRYDLVFARNCLHTINDNQNILIRNALWFSAVAHFIKCFGDNKSRSHLVSDKIFKGDDLAKEVFTFFKNVRNKHFIHDENALMQCIPNAVLNKKEAPYKIAKILATTFITPTLIEGNYSNLTLLIDRTYEWVEKEFNKLAEMLTKELEALSYEELLKMPEAIFEHPLIENVNESRKKK